MRRTTSPSENLRSPAVAGMFYPAQAEELAALVRDMLTHAGHAYPGRPKALIAPHAGFIYSGPVAANAFRSLEKWCDELTRVVLLGPAHRMFVEGMAFPTIQGFTTPLGTIPLDREALDQALALPYVIASDAAHAQEHCLEVQLPFLQQTLGDFTLVPFLVGQCPPEPVAAVLEQVWGGPETLIVVSSDLSHYHPYETATLIDAETSRRIEVRSHHLEGEKACGAHAINGLMMAAVRHGLRVHTLDVRNSGDTSGERDRVVGYGAYALA